MLQKWASFLMFDGTMDGVARALSMILIALVIVKYSSLFEQEYNKKLTTLFLQPWWRFLVILLTLFAAFWCPRVGMLMALLVFFYFSDMETLINPLSNL